VIADESRGGACCELDFRCREIFFSCGPSALALLFHQPLETIDIEDIFLDLTYREATDLNWALGVARQAERKRGHNQMFDIIQDTGVAAKVMGAAHR